MKKSSKRLSVKRKRSQIEWPTQVFVEISTAHICKADGLKLSEPICQRVIAQIDDGSGHLLHIGAWSREEIIEDFSFDFANLIEQLQHDGFAYLRLDADAPVVKGLPQYSW